MGLLNITDNILRNTFGAPITFFSDVEAKQAKKLLEKQGIRIGRIDKVEDKDWGTTYNFWVDRYNDAVKILKQADIL